jgi:cardiolipin synthase
MKAAPTDTLWTLPNVVSLSRVLLAAGFVASSGTSERAMLVGAASFTDFLDGWLARRRNAVSRAGALIDPIADRVFVLTAVATFLAAGQLALWQCVVLLSRDVMTAIGFIVARVIPWLRTIAFQARPIGKAVTACQLATLFAVLLWPAATGRCIAIVGVVSLVAVVDYTWALWLASEPGRRARS